MRGVALKVAFFLALAFAGASWPHPAGADDPFSERVDERRRMVETQLRGFGRTPVTNTAVLAAMLKVPRHSFIPESNRQSAYDDSPVPVGQGQTISQPYVVALMTQALELTQGMKVLEIGTGSGYQAAVLAEITPEVYTVEINRQLCETARQTLDRLGYRSIKVREGDGYFGWKEFAPFDRIIVTCAAPSVPQDLLDQLSANGRLVMPVGGPYEAQRLLLITKDADCRQSSKTLELVRFVPLLREAPQN